METLGRNLGAEIFHNILIYKQPPFGVKICLDICPPTLSVLRSEQFSESVRIFGQVTCSDQSRVIDGFDRL